LILVTNQTLNFKEQISALTIKLYNDNTHDLIIISDNFSKEILDAFKMSKITNQFNIIPIKTPFFGRKEKSEDIAIALNAKFIDKDLNMKCEEVTIKDLGTAKKIVVEKDRMVIFGAKGDTKARLKEIKEEITKAKTKFDKDQLEKRLAKLTNGIGVIRVASTETDRTYLKKKINNAINTTKFALEQGVVKGGGLALKEIADKMTSNLLTKALSAPYHQIQSNAGGKIEITDNVIDAVKTTKVALKTACNLAGLLLTVEVAIADKREKPKDFSDEE
jgi:chaperonin GroEL